MSTTGHGRHSILRIFKGSRGRIGHHTTFGALLAAGPYLRLSRFQATVAPSYSSGLVPCPVCRVSVQLGTVTQLLVHLSSHVLLTKYGPLGALDFVARSNIAATPSYLFKVCSHSNPSQKIRVGRRCNPQGEPTNQTPWSVFQDGPNGEPTGRRPKHAHAKTRLRHVLPSTIATMTSPRAFQQPGLRPPSQSASVNVFSRSADRLGTFHIRPKHIAGPHLLPSQQFQALFDSLFKVLFIFPSRYLFAIGLSPVFSLGRNLPPDWCCIPKKPDSPTAPRGATGSGH
ncbi:hypothetical protein LR48_Vigan05g084400 [Vigna angularis]|uniref:Uncharacterized protein n=1 Tax=Phaseolus angularis TaxID=3914 RepID=A0A0L9UK29_PHAAN|nr:hypothetical protein LR48_Vigan05g084400 [Vigna angularis]